MTYSARKFYSIISQNAATTLVVFLQITVYCCCNSVSLKNSLIKGELTFWFIVRIVLDATFVWIKMAAWYSTSTSPSSRLHVLMIQRWVVIRSHKPTRSFRVDDSMYSRALNIHEPVRTVWFQRVFSSADIEATPCGGEFLYGDNCCGKRHQHRHGSW